MSGPEGDNAFSGFPFGAQNSFGGMASETHTFPQNTWEADPEARTAFIVLDDVLSIQSLVMSYQKAANRSKLSKEGRHAFVALNAMHSNPDEAFDGSEEEYLTCRVAKLPKDATDRESFRYDQWSMRVRFTQNSLVRESSAVSFVDEYLFSWQRSRLSPNASSAAIQAWFGASELYSTGQGPHRDWLEIDPIRPAMITDLQERMKTHMFQASVTDALRMGRRADALGR